LEHQSRLQIVQHRSYSKMGRIFLPNAIVPRQENPRGQVEPLLGAGGDDDLLGRTSDGARLADVGCDGYSQLGFPPPSPKPAGAARCVVRERLPDFFHASTGAAAPDGTAIANGTGASGKSARKMADYLAACGGRGGGDLPGLETLTGRALQTASLSSRETLVPDPTDASR